MPLTSLPPQYLLLALVLAGSFVLAAIAAVQARRRGYSFLVWLAGGTLSGNPVLFLVLLALLPDFARKRLRRRERAARAGEW